MPTPEDAPSAVISQKILASALDSAGIEGWTQSVFEKACLANDVTPSEVAYAFPDGIRSLVPAYFQGLRGDVRSGLEQLPLSEMRIRDKITSGVELWLNEMSKSYPASVKALDWATIRPTGPCSMPEIIWGVADTLWTGIGDTSFGFTYYSKRTTLSAVITSTLAVWRNTGGDEAEWKPFLARRIEDVMTFEKFKAKVKLPEIALPF